MVLCCHRMPNTAAGSDLHWVAVLQRVNLVSVRAYDLGWLQYVNAPSLLKEKAAGQDFSMSLLTAFPPVSCQ